MDIKEQIKNLPEEPGVYLFYNKDGLVVYVGKSKCIRKRVQNYFTSSGDSRAFVQNLPQELGRIHFIVTYTEKEALLLENSLIRKHKPNYNIRFKDDSSYISLKLEISNTFPRLTLVKKVNNKSSLYFGPYTSQGALKNTLQVIKKAFPLRTCTDSEFKRRTRPCMVYQIHRCQAPCVGRQTQKEYQETVSRLILFLKGKDKTLCENLKKQMEKESSELNFEKAIRLRNQLFALQKTTEKQIVLSHKDQNQDVFVCEKKQDSAIIQAMHIRSGKVISTKSTLSMDLHSSSEILSAYLKHYYCKEVFLPDEILLGEKIEDQEVLSILVSEKKGKKVPILLPKRGEKKKMIELALKNAKVNHIPLKKQRSSGIEILSNIKKKLYLMNFPSKMECYDISNIQGAYAVGSKVVFEMGEPLKEEYRKYKIREVQQADDFAMMKEVLGRRFSKISNSEDLPDLVVVDGGKGQLHVAKKILEELSIQGVDLVGLAKSRKKNRKGHLSESPERFFLLNREDPVVLPEDSKELFLLQRLRDEAHRFAITYHRTLRNQEILGRKKQ